MSVGYAFVDVDGVLNTGDHLRQAAPSLEIQQSWNNDPDKVLAYWTTLIQPELVARLNAIIKACAQSSGGVSAILTSTWRARGLSTVQTCLDRQGATFRLMGQTPSKASRLSQPMETRDPKRYCLGNWLSIPLRETHARGLDVEQWLLTHVDHSDLPNTPIIIIDDWDSFDRLKVPWHLHTDRRPTPNDYGITGLTDDDVSRALEHFQPLGDVLERPHKYWTPGAAARLYPGGQNDGVG